MAGSGAPAAGPSTVETSRAFPTNPEFDRV